MATRRAHGNRRGEIVAAVRELCGERGVGHVSVTAVTERLGVTRSLFYHYFPSMDAAVEAALDSVVDDVLAQMRIWNAGRVRGNVEQALRDVIRLMKQAVLDDAASAHPFYGSGDAGFLTSFTHRVSDRTARYICETTVVDYAAHHRVRIDHVYETFYVLITGLIMYVRTHPDVPDDVLVDVAANTLHIEAFLHRGHGRGANAGAGASGAAGAKEIGGAPGAGPGETE